MRIDMQEALRRCEAELDTLDMRSQAAYKAIAARGANGEVKAAIRPLGFYVEPIQREQYQFDRRCLLTLDALTARMRTLQRTLDASKENSAGKETV